MSTADTLCDRCKQPAYSRYSSTGFAPWMCVECVSGQRNIITPMPIAMSPIVQALTAQRDALRKDLGEMEAERNRFRVCVLLNQPIMDEHAKAEIDLMAQRDALLEALRDLADTNNDFSEALVRARRAIALATTDTTEKP